MTTAMSASEFHDVFDTEQGRTQFLKFLQNIFHLYPEDKFQGLIVDACKTLRTDKEIYQQVQAGLPAIKPFLSDLTLALPALKKQKREMARQTLEILGGRSAFDGYLEIGSTGRYISALRKHVNITGPIHITNDIAPTYSPNDLMERGRLRPFGTFHMLDYQPLDTHGVAPGSISLMTCFIGLHHATPPQLDAFSRSMNRVMKKGGVLIIRDHDAGTPAMQTFCSLVHTVFNLGLKVSWETNDSEPKFFKSAGDWSQYLTARGFRDLGKRILQDGDPSDNTLMGFEKTDEAG